MSKQPSYTFNSAEEAQQFDNFCVSEFGYGFDLDGATASVPEGVGYTAANFRQDVGYFREVRDPSLPYVLQRTLRMLRAQIAELQQANQPPHGDRLISLAVTDLQSAENWLKRYELQQTILEQEKK